jgi:outer membrane lipoprotein-sorting protein
MNSADKIKLFFKKAELSINSDTDEEIFQDVLQAQQKTIKQKPARPANIGRIIMKSHLTKFAAAAIIIIALIAGITMFNKTSSFALADVLEHIKQVNAVFYQQKMNATTPLMGMEMNQNTNSKVWISQDYGMRMDMEMAITTNVNSIDPNEQETLTQTYLIPNQNQIVSIIPDQKKYIRAELNDKQALATRQQGNDPNLMVQQFLDCNYVSIGKSTIDGIEVEGFQTNDPNFQGGMYSSGQVDFKLWVDVKTQLPVQMEMDIQLSGQTNMTMHSVTYGFQWNVPVDASIFEPVIPDDYTSFTSAPVQMSYDENTVIKSLKLYNELFGKYPEKLDLAGLTSPLYELMQKLPEMSKDSENLPPFLKKLEEEMKGLSEEEQKQKTMDFTMELTTSITGLSTFYSQLVQQQKDPAYYGNIITPQDFDQVLMRWKVSDNQYRIVFGNLHTETVTSDVLAELEKYLPK